MKQFNPFDKSSLYEIHAPRWQAELDFSEMTQDVLDSGKYLPRFSQKEHEDDYKYRRSMSCALDMIRDAVRLRLDCIWRTSPRRIVGATKYESIIAGLVDNCDDYGTPLDDFMRKAALRHYVTGCDIVTQLTGPPENSPDIVTKADALAAGIRPFFAAFSPLERYWWTTDGAGNIMGARYCLGAVAESDETDEPDGSVKFLSLIGRQWRVWVATPGKNDLKVTLLASGEHNLPRPPIVKLYFSESAKPGYFATPLSLVTRPTRIAIVAMNLKSQADVDLLAAVPRWFLSGFDGDVDSYGPTTLIRAAQPEARMAVIQGDCAHIAEKREWLMLYLHEILRLLKFRGSMADLEGSASSGVKLALEHNDLHNELRSTASQLERADIEMMRQACVLATGEDISSANAQEILGYDVSYERDFVLEPVGEMLDNLRRLAVDCSWVAEETPSMVKEILRQISDALVRPGSNRAAEIEQEIEEAGLEGIAAFRPAESLGEPKMTPPSE